MERIGDGVRGRLARRMGRPLRHVDLMELGLQKYDVERLLRNGLLQRAHGRYVDGRLDEPLARAACAQAAHPTSVISHFTAAELTGLRVWTDRVRRPAASAIWLSCEPGRKRNLKRTDIVLRRAGLTAPDLQLHQGLWLTSDARTTVDIARELPLREAAVTVDHALSRSVSPRRARGCPGASAPVARRTEGPSGSCLGRPSLRVGPGVVRAPGVPGRRAPGSRTSSGVLGRISLAVAPRRLLVARVPHRRGSRRSREVRGSDTERTPPIAPPVVRARPATF